VLLVMTATVRGFMMMVMMTMMVSITVMRGAVMLVQSLQNAIMTHTVTQYVD